MGSHANARAAPCGDRRRTRVAAARVKPVRHAAPCPGARPSRRSVEQVEEDVDETRVVTRGFQPTAPGRDARCSDRGNGGIATEARGLICFPLPAALEAAVRHEREDPRELAVVEPGPVLLAYIDDDAARDANRRPWR